MQEKSLTAQQNRSDERSTALEDTDEELIKYRGLYTAAVEKIEVLEHKNAQIREQLNETQQTLAEIENSASWKITEPVRKCLDLLKRIPILFLIIKAMKFLKNKGLRFTLIKVRNKLIFWRRKYRRKKPLYTSEELEQQRKEHFPKQIQFSIIVPLYNTPESFLREMIQSVLNQTYSDWQLCMADGSNGEHGEVEKICRAYSEIDKRICYRKLEKNLGISGNTNACLDMATGDYIALFDHDDLLHPAALHDVMKEICGKDADFIYTDESIFRRKPADAFMSHFKPDYAPDTLRANNYICHLTVFKKSLLEKVGGFRPECDGSQDFDMVLRLTEQAKSIVHIPKSLYYWRAHSDSVAESLDSKPYVFEAARRAIRDHLKRVGLEGEVTDSPARSIYRIRYKLKGMPLVSILIPNYEHKSMLEDCLNSIFEKTTYPNFEIILIDNNSVSEEMFSYYREIQSKWSNIRVIRWESGFNCPAMNNFGATFAKGEHLLLLSSDTEVISPEWIQEMLMFSQRTDVGAVGAKLYYADYTVQHAGIGIGIGQPSFLGYYFKGTDHQNLGYMGRLAYAQNLSAVTGACVMIRRSVWDETGGLDKSFEVAFNDVDLCMRIRKLGYLIVWTPFAELYHYESKRRRSDDTPEEKERFQREVERFQKRWERELALGDPYYNPNFSWPFLF